MDLRRIDALVAEHVLNIKLLPNGWEQDDRKFYGYLPTYSSDIAAAWEVVRQFHLFRLERLENDIQGGETWSAEFIPAPYGSGETTCAIADDPALAICLAALKAKKIELPTENE